MGEGLELKLPEVDLKGLVSLVGRVFTPLTIMVGLLRASLKVF